MEMEMKCDKFGTVQVNKGFECVKHNGKGYAGNIVKVAAYLGSEVEDYNLTAMEKAMVRLIADYGLSGEGNPDRGQPDYTGV